MANLPNQVENKITLSVDSPLCNRPSYISAKQLDVNSRFLRVTLVGENGVIRPAGPTQLNARRPDDQEIFIPGTVNDDGTISFTLRSDVLALPGSVACDVTVFEANDEELASLTSSTFHIIVSESMFSEEAWEGEDHSSIFSEAIKTVANLEAKTRESSQNAKESENNAKASETKASESAKEAADSEQNAKNSESAAKASETAAAGSAQRAANSEASAKEHADTIQETVDTLADDYQAVIEEVDFLKTKIFDASINPDDLNVEFDREEGVLYLSYLNVRSKNGWDISESFDVATFEEVKQYLSI